jgi:hypothetical protein
VTDAIEDRPLKLCRITDDDDGNPINPWPNAPYIPQPPLSWLRKAWPLPPREVAD